MRSLPPNADLNGVNLAGYLRTESGVGSLGRRYVRALEALGVPVSLHDISRLTGNRSHDDSYSAFQKDNPYAINLVCADVEPQYAIMNELGPDFFTGKYNIAIWAWELPRFPEKWSDRFGYYDEVWVGSSFIASALAPVAPIPVVRIPPPLSIQAGTVPGEAQQRLGIDADEFTFLFIFDFHSHVERKNPLGVIEAFKLAFRSDDKVRLILKYVNAHSAPEALKELEAAAKSCSVTLCGGYWPAAEVRDLMRASDAYVSLHRSEGLGFTITDALALGKPVIATGWSGNMDFMNISNSFPVEFQLEEIDRNVGPYMVGGVWANPNIEHAAAMLRSVYENRADAHRRGEAARRDINRNFSEGSVAGMIAQRLSAIHIRQRYESFRAEMWQNYRDYRSLGTRIRVVVESAVPVASTVLVASKGDDALLDLNGRTGWHFPQTAEGVYAGAYPADSQEAITHLQTLYSKGARYLVFPHLSLWWLDYYAGLRDYLESHGGRLAYQEDACALYALDIETDE